LELKQRLAQLSEAYEREFARNRDLHGERIQCRAGCDSCCGQLFQITEIEAAVVSEGIRALEPGLRERVAARALEYLPRRAALFADGERWGSTAPEGTRLPCPALESGVCQIYEHRPLICRKFGMPLWNPDRPGRVQACELNFRPGEPIDDGELIQIQTALHHEAKALQAAYNAQGLPRDDAPLTVARAIVEDFRGFLEK
jgi:Fe-S-cluster containining protein